MPGFWSLTLEGLVLESSHKKGILTNKIILKPLNLIQLTTT